MTQVDYLAKFWMVIAHIPKGKVATYGDVAAMAGYPRMARAVGRCLKNLPQDSNLPWHRVLNAKGMLSFPQDSAKYRQQRQLLESEGVLFQQHKIALARHRWRG
jgi:methylated-DNA-protein-cysteine methyltransferase-like protein